MARPRKPKHIKEAQGTLAPSREVKNPLKLKDVDGLPAPPNDIGKQGKVYWRFVIHHLADVGEMKEAFLASIIVACKWYQILMDAFDEIDRAGAVVETKTGYTTISGALSAADKAARHLKKFENEFGLNLVSSQNIPGRGREDDIDEIIK